MTFKCNTWERVWLPWRSVVTMAGGAENARVENEGVQCVKLVGTGVVTKGIPEATI